MNMGKLLKPALYGFISSILLLAIYFFVMTLAKSSFSSALDQLNSLKLWVIPLILTFGIQVGLFVYVKECNKDVRAAPTTVSATTSGAAMIACCAHHITDILPLIGLSVLSTLLAKYQVWFFAIGLLSNLIGISIMLKHLKIIKI